MPSLNIFCFLFLGNDDVTDCAPCQAGKYCEGTGNTKPTADCDQGYFCPPGQHLKNPSAHICTPGHYCPTGSPAQILCESGYWTDLSKQSECKECVQGYYCDRTDGPISNYVLYPCAEGFYCPNGTRYSTQHGCPNGTYGNRTKLIDASQCLFCPAGRYCLGKFRRNEDFIVLGVHKRIIYLGSSCYVLSGCCHAF